LSVGAVASIFIVRTRLRAVWPRRSTASTTHEWRPVVSGVAKTRLGPWSGRPGRRRRTRGTSARPTGRCPAATSAPAAPCACRPRPCRCTAGSAGRHRPPA
jgi:hypothetical protein